MFMKFTAVCSPKRRSLKQLQALALAGAEAGGEAIQGSPAGKGPAAAAKPAAAGKPATKVSTTATCDAHDQTACLLRCNAQKCEDKVTWLHCHQHSSSRASRLGYALGTCQFVAAFHWRRLPLCEKALSI